MKKYIFIIAGLSLFFIGGVSHATVTTFYQQGNLTQATGFTVGQNPTYTQRILSSFSLPSDQTLNQIEIKEMSSGVGNRTAQIVIEAFGRQIATSTYQTTPTGSFSFSDTGCSLAGGAYDCASPTSTITFDTPVQLQKQVIYTVVMNLGTSVLTGVAGYQDWYRLQNNIPQASLTWVYPQNATSSDFGVWQLTASNGDVGCSAGWVTVKYWDTQYPNDIFRDTQQYLPCVQTTSIQIPKENALLYPQDTYSRTWTAQALWYLQDNTVPITSSTITFTINQFNSSIPHKVPYRNSTTTDFTGESSSSPFFVDCSAYDNVPFFSSGTIAGIGCSMRKAGAGILGFLVKPPDAVNTYLNDAFENLKHAFPFSIAFEVKDSIQNAVTNAPTTTTTLAFTIPGHGTYTVLTPTTLDDTIGSSTKAQVFQVIKYVIWLGTGIIIFTTII